MASIVNPPHERHPGGIVPSDEIGMARRHFTV
jgi:hypothetical protein